MAQLSEGAEQPDKLILLTGITAAKKLLALHWKPPQKATKAHWMNTYIDTVNMELSVHGARAGTTSSWQTITEKNPKISCKMNIQYYNLHFDILNFLHWRPMGYEVGVGVGFDLSAFFVLLSFLFFEVR